MAVELQTRSEVSVPADAKHQLLIVKHFYQPFRRYRLLSDPNPNARASIEPSAEHLDGFPTINDKIFWECYFNGMVQQCVSGPEASPLFPPGTLNSFLPSLRGWIKYAHPQHFETIRENIKAIGEDKKFRILGDHYLHLPLPDELPESQKMWTEIGLKAFKRDLGFYPAGIWSAEQMLSKTTIGIFHSLQKPYGLEFTTARDHQVTNSYDNPVYVPVVDDNGRQIGEFPIVHYDSRISGPYSFEGHVTDNADNFLEEAKKDRAELRKEQGVALTDPEIIGVGTDGELYGHHQKGRQYFAEYVSREEVLKKHGYIAFDVKKALANPRHASSELVDPSSWSCAHGIGRWTGQCRCGVADDYDQEKKLELYGKTKSLEKELYGALEITIPDWRSRFTDIVLETEREVFFEGDIYDKLNDMSGNAGLGFLADSRKRDLILAVYAHEISKLSCRMFFAGVDGLERQLGWQNNREAEILFGRATGIV